MKILSVLPFLFFAYTSYAQDSYAAKFKDATLSYEEKKYKQVVDIIKPLLKDDGENSNLHYKIGMAYTNMPLGDADAVKHLEIAVKNTTANYDTYSSTEKSAPREAIFHLAEAYLDNGEPQKAKEQYEAFMTQVPAKHKLNKYAKLGVEHSDNAIAFMADPIDVKVTNLGDKINSEYHEHSPVLTLDENTIYYTSRRLRADSSNQYQLDDQTGWHYEDIYTSSKDVNGEWSEPKILEFSRVSDHDATLNLSGDGNSLYIYRDTKNGTLLKSEKAGEEWVSPVRIPGGINTDAFENHLSVSVDNQMLFFSSDRKGGFGGMDIYVCKRLPTGKWGLPQNLGATINTEFDDNAPNIHPDGRTLFFTSRGHKNMGGYDIFSSKLSEEDNQTWSTPENVGYPLNTTHDEEIFYVSPDGRRGYFSSYAKGGHGLGDIYMVELAESEASGLTLLKGKIIIPDSMEFPEDIRILIHDNETGKVVGEARPNKRNGSYVFIIPPGKDYRVSYMLDGKEFYSESTFVPMGTEYREIEKEVGLNPVTLQVDTDSSATEAQIAGNTQESNIPSPNTAENKTSEEVKASDTDLIETTIGNNSITYKTNFGYNKNKINVKDSEFKTFVSDAKEILQKNGSLVLAIESGASRVPTKSFSSNKELAKKRAYNAKELLISELNKAGLDASKITWLNVTYLVQGPEYKKDFKNTSKYEKYQYVKYWTVNSK